MSMTLVTEAPSSAIRLQAEQPRDAMSIEGLLGRAFGPGRFTKVSERVREFATFAPELSFCALEGARLCGSVRMWRVHLDGRPVVFLGPLAVETTARGGGVGGLLVERACEAARAVGESCVMLVGDEPYFARLGFTAEPARAIRMPGPVDQRRVLVRALVPGGADDLAGPLRR